MKYLLTTAMMCICATAFAQDQQPEKKPKPVLQTERKNEAGIIIQTDFGQNNNVNFSLAGAQYNRWITPHLGYRVIGAYGNYSSTSATTTYLPHPDTVIMKQQHMSFDMPVVGFGFVAQRQFYKRVVLYAALEVKGGYGRGRTDTSVRAVYKQGFPESSEAYTRTPANHEASILLINMSASVGAKLQFSRMSFGIELLPAQLAYTKIDYKGRYGGIADFELGNFSQRCFLNYRF